MRKLDELSDPGSCLNKASDDEFLFVLRGHDPASPAAIRAWVAERLRLGKNTPIDPQIVDAIDIACLMETTPAERSRQGTLSLAVESPTS